MPCQSRVGSMCLYPIACLGCWGACDGSGRELEKVGKAGFIFPISKLIEVHESLLYLDEK